MKTAASLSEDIELKGLLFNLMMLLKSNESDLLMDDLIIM